MPTDRTRRDFTRELLRAGARPCSVSIGIRLSAPAAARGLFSVESERCGAASGLRHHRRLQFWKGFTPSLGVLSCDDGPTAHLACNEPAGFDLCVARRHTNAVAATPLTEWVGVPNVVFAVHRKSSSKPTNGDKRRHSRTNMDVHLTAALGLAGVAWASCGSCGSCGAPPLGLSS
jgi:hypothetical protein